jgi:pSer/pThr/pTyr-binding forkhead associated (FHA) protein
MRAWDRDRRRAAAALPVALPAAGVATVGRSSRCDVVVADPSVSRRHLELRAVDGGWLAVDLGSTNGTWRSGRRVARTPVAAGDELVLGDRPIVLG